MAVVAAFEFTMRRAGCPARQSNRRQRGLGPEWTMRTSGTRHQARDGFGHGHFGAHGNAKAQPIAHHPRHRSSTPMRVSGDHRPPVRCIHVRCHRRRSGRRPGALSRERSRRRTERRARVSPRARHQGLARVNRSWLMSFSCLAHDRRIEARDGGHGVGRVENCADDGDEVGPDGDDLPGISGNAADGHRWQPEPGRAAKDDNGPRRATVVPESKQAQSQVAGARAWLVRRDRESAVARGPSIGRFPALPELPLFPIERAQVRACRSISAASRSRRWMSNGNRCAWSGGSKPGLLPAQLESAPCGQLKACHTSPAGLHSRDQSPRIGSSGVSR